jgi:hypothetical protein
MTTRAGRDSVSRSALIPFPAKPNTPRRIWPAVMICRMVERLCEGRNQYPYNRTTARQCKTHQEKIVAEHEKNGAKAVVATIPVKTTEGVRIPSGDPFHDVETPSPGRVHRLPESRLPGRSPHPGGHPGGSGLLLEPKHRRNEVRGHHPRYLARPSNDYTTRHLPYPWSGGGRESVHPAGDLGEMRGRLRGPRSLAA